MTAKIMPNYPNYSITEDGVVRNVKTDKVIKQHINKDGYLQLSICNGRVIKTYVLHLLIYECWVFKDGETMPKMLDHIDCNKINNTPINLRAATNQENQRNRLINKNSKSRHKNIHLAKCGNFRVEIRIDLYIRYRKTHKTLALAVEDRDRVLLKHFGAFSNNGVVS